MPDRSTLYTDPSTGLPFEILSEFEVWGGGTLAQRPPAGSEIGDLFFLLDGGAIRLQIWDGGQWVDLSALAFGAAGGDLQGSFPNPTLDLDSFDGGRFGQDYQQQKNSTPASTTSSTFQVYDTFTIPADTLDPAGLYRIGVAWSVTGSSAFTEVESRFLINGTPSKSVIIEPRVTGSVVPLYAADDFSGAINVGNPITIELDYRRAGGGGSAGVDSAVFELWRVS